MYARHTYTRNTGNSQESKELRPGTKLGTDWEQTGNIMIPASDSAIAGRWRNAPGTVPNSSTVGTAQPGLSRFGSTWHGLSSGSRPTLQPRLRIPATAPTRQFPNPRPRPRIGQLVLLRRAVRGPRSQPTRTRRYRVAPPLPPIIGHGRDVAQQGLSGRTAPARNAGCRSRRADRLRDSLSPGTRWTAERQ